MGQLMKFLYLALVLFGMLQVLIYFWHAQLAGHQKLKETWMHNTTWMHNKADFETECKAFTYDKSEWTLIMKDNTYDYTNCQNLTELLIGGNIKQVIHRNGSKEIRGCTKYTAMCKEASHYDNSSGIRINTPPCCRKKSIDIFKHVTEELQRLKVTHMLSHGGVIGWVRSKKMIPYDNDLDIIVENNFWKSETFWSFLKGINLLYGHVYVFRDNNLKIWIQYSQANKNIIDIWPYNIEDGKLGIYNYDTVLQPVQNIFPLQHGLFEDIVTYLPNDPINYLKTEYGENWRTELTCKRKQGRNCIS